MIDYYCLLLPLQVSKEFFPRVAVGYEDPRVNLHIGDGICSIIFSTSPSFCLISQLHLLMCFSCCRRCISEGCS